MNIVNCTPIFNIVNNGWIYLCQADDGTYWIRSVTGNWAQVIDLPLALQDIEADFQAYMKSGALATLTDVIQDNSNAMVVAPTVKTIPVL